MRLYSIIGAFICAAALFVSGAWAQEGSQVRASAQIDKDIASILDGVSEIDAPGVPGPLVVFGEDAFPLVVGAGPRDVTAPVVAAGFLGEARVVAYGHDGYLMTGALTTADTGTLMANSVRWAAGGKTKPSVATHRLQELRDFLAQEGIEAEELAGKDWYADLSSYDVVCVNAVWLETEDEVKALRAFAKKGGGLVIGGLGWGWSYLNPGKSLREDFLGNKLFGPAGILWADGTLNRTSEKGFKAGGDISELNHADRALDALIAHAEGTRELTAQETAHASWLATNTLRALPPDDKVLLPRFREVARDHGVDAVPGPDNPLGVDHPLGRLVFTMEFDTIKDLPPEQVEAHPSATAFPGAVPDEAKRITKTHDVNTAVPGWHSTGLYAAPGEMIEVTLPAEASGKGLLVRIGAHNDSIWHHDKWTRCPEVCRRFPVDGAVTNAANAFGGPVYIEVPDGCALGTIAVTIDGAVEAPHYIHGTTDVKAWRDEIRHRPGPWTELETSKVILTVPSDAIRALDDPDELMTFWDQVLDACADLAARPRERPRAERYTCDTQISNGYMHAGYPIMTHLDIVPVIVDKDAIIANKHGGIWGLFHEVGHNHQQGDWTFAGTGEVTENLFTLYVYETVCGRTAAQHPSFAEEARTAAITKYLDGGADFEQWKREPFTGLIMYIQMQEAFGWDTYKKVFAEYRDLPDAERPKTDDEKRDQWMVRFSREIGKDLGPFFEAWGVPTSDEARASIADLPDWMPEGFPPEQTTSLPEE